MPAPKEQNKEQRSGLHGGKMQGHQKDRFLSVVGVGMSLHAPLTQNDYEMPTPKEQNKEQRSPRSLRPQTDPQGSDSATRNTEIPQALTSTRVPGFV
jgi:hypothetical protein